MPLVAHQHIADTTKDQCWYMDFSGYWIELKKPIVDFSEGQQHSSNQVVSNDSKQIKRSSGKVYEWKQLKNLAVEQNFKYLFW